MSAFSKFYRSQKYYNIAYSPEFRKSVRQTYELEYLSGQQFLQFVASGRNRNYCNLNLGDKGKKSLDDSELYAVVCARIFIVIPVVGAELNLPSAATSSAPTKGNGCTTAVPSAGTNKTVTH